MLVLQSFTIATSLEANPMKFRQNIQKQWQAWLLGYRFIQLVQAPYGDFAGIGKLAAVTSDRRNLQQIVEFLSQEPSCKQALEKRSLLGQVDLAQLHQLPPETLGYRYADHMLRNGFTPPPTRNQADNPYTFMGQHLGETHDIWHIVTGCDTDVSGEIKLQAFYIAQIYPSKFWMALLAKNLLKTALEDPEHSHEHLEALVQGWALGKQAKPLFGIEWNQLWETPLSTLQSQLKITSQSQGSLLPSGCEA
jgi:ubiquinone biosynthesis protein COQ4